MARYSKCTTCGIDIRYGQQCRSCQKAAYRRAAAEKGAGRCRDCGRKTSFERCGACFAAYTDRMRAAGYAWDRDNRQWVLAAGSRDFAYEPARHGMERI